MTLVGYTIVYKRLAFRLSAAPPFRWYVAINWLFHPTITIVVLGEGTDYDKDVSDTEKRNITTVDTLMDLVRNLFPENIIQASLEKVQTVSIYPGAAIVFVL